MLYSYMPVVGRFKFVIYPKDHFPSHVHILADGAEAKFDLNTGDCLAVYGFSKQTVNRLSKIVLKNSSLLMEAWKEYEGEE